MSARGPGDAAAVLEAQPEPARRCLLALRALVFGVARDLGVDTLCETLKWGQPAYVPGRGGTTIRLGLERDGSDCMLMVHCQTTLVETWRRRFAGRLRFQGNRAILIDPEMPLPEAELKQCIADALTYRQRAWRAADG